jgi:hypothetical protein
VDSLIALSIASPGFAGEILNPANQFFLLTFGVLEIVISELGSLLL